MDIDNTWNVDICKHGQFLLVSSFIQEEGMDLRNRYFS